MEGINDNNELKGVENNKSPQLPIEGFPKKIQEFINNYTNVYQVPRDYIAASVLFSSAFAIGSKLELVNKYKNVPVLWMVIVGDVSIGKTHPLKISLEYFNELDEKAFKEFETKYKKFEKFKNSGMKKNVFEVDREKPKLFKYLLKDYTPEALYDAHSVNNRGLCIYRDEIIGWIDDFNRYNKSGEETNMLSTFTQGSFSISRVGKLPLRIDNTYIYVAGTTQPELILKLSKNSRAENGFLSRFLFVMPEKAKKPYYSEKSLDKELYENFQKSMKFLTLELEPLKLNLSNEASEAYKEWFNKNTDLVNNNETHTYLRGVYGKLDIYLYRIAIVIHGMKLYDNNNSDDSSTIKEESMIAAISIIEYFRKTAHSVFDILIGGGKVNKKDEIINLNSLGITQTEIAKILNIKQPYVSKILRENKL